MVLTTPLIAELARRGPVDVVTTPASARAAREPSGDARASIAVRQARRATAASAGFMRARGAAARASRVRRRVSRAGLGAKRGARACVAGIRERVGFATSAGRAVLHDDACAYRDDLHHAARLLALARADGREPTRRASCGRASIPGDAGARARWTRCSRARRRRRRAADRARAGQRLGDEALAVLRRARARRCATGARIVVVGGARRSRAGGRDRRGRGAERDRRDGRAVAARLGGADPPVRGARDERLRAAASRVGDGYADGRDLRTDGARLRIRPARADASTIVGHECARLPPVRPARAADAARSAIGAACASSTAAIDVRALARATLILYALTHVVPWPPKTAAAVHHRRRPRRHEHRRRRAAATTARQHLAMRSIPTQRRAGRRGGRRSHRRARSKA